MASSNVLKEFLVKIRYDVDEQSYKNYQNKLGSITKMVEGLGKISIVAGGALSTFLLKTASEMEKLYFAAQRAGTTVGSLMGLRFAAEQIGIGAEAATAGITGLATAIRTNPGLKLFFTQLGLKDTGDNTKNFINLISKLQTLSSQGQYGHAIATQIASQFGIDEQTLFMYEKHLPELIKAQREFQRAGLLGGIDVDKQGEAFHKFMVDVRTLLMHAELLAIAFGGKLLPAAEGLVRFLDRAVMFMLRMNAATHGLSTLFAGISATFASIFGATKILGMVSGLLGSGGAAAAGGGVAAAGEAAGGGILAVVGGTAGIVAIVAAVAAVAVGWLAYHYKDDIKAAGSSAWSSTMGFIAGLEGKSKKVYRDIAGHLTVGYGHKVLPGEDFSGGVSDAQSVNILARDTATAAAAVHRLVRIMLNKNQTAALTDFAFSAGAGAFAKSTLLKDVNAGNMAGAANEFLKWNHAGGKVSPGLTNRRLGERAMFQKPDVSMNQSTTIHVSGDDPRATANLVAQQQRGVNGDIVRDMAAKVQ